MRFVILARVIDGVDVELRDCGEITSADLRLFAARARHEGFHLMYECNSAPDMEEAAQLARENKLVSMSCVKRLWDLTA